jgi:hypothetical protein
VYGVRLASCLRALGSRFVSTKKRCTPLHLFQFLSSHFKDAPPSRHELLSLLHRSQTPNYCAKALEVSCQHLSRLPGAPTLCAVSVSERVLASGTVCSSVPPNGLRKHKLVVRAPLLQPTTLILSLPYCPYGWHFATRLSPTPHSFVRCESTASQKVVTLPTHSIRAGRVGLSAKPATLLHSPVHHCLHLASQLHSITFALASR